MELVRNMGISIVALADGRVQLLHSVANVRQSNQTKLASSKSTSNRLLLLRTARRA